MTMSAEMSLNSVACVDEPKIGPFALGYLKAAARDEAHELVLNRFLTECDHNPTISRAFVARRIGKSPEQITRLFASPGNWTIDTLTSLLAALGYKPTFSDEKICDMRWSNSLHPLAMSASKEVKSKTNVTSEVSLPLMVNQTSYF